MMPDNGDKYKQKGEHEQKGNVMYVKPGSFWRCLSRDPLVCQRKGRRLLMRVAMECYGQL